MHLKVKFSSAYLCVKLHCAELKRGEADHCTNVRLCVLASAVAEALPHSEAAQTQHHAWMQTPVPLHTQRVPEHHTHPGRRIRHLHLSLGEEQVHGSFCQH